MLEIVPNSRYPRVEGVQQTAASRDPIFNGACYAMCLLGPGLSSDQIQERLHEAVRLGFMMENGWVLNPTGLASLGMFTGLANVWKSKTDSKDAKLRIACLNNGEHFVIVQPVGNDRFEITYDPWRNSNASSGQITSLRLLS